MSLAAPINFISFAMAVSVKLTPGTVFINRYRGVPQQNVRKLFFSFRKVWGYTASLILWFTKKSKNCAKKE